MLHALALALGGTLLLAAALHDSAFRTVPNAVPAALAALGLALRAAAGDLVAGLAAAAAVFAMLLFCWHRGWLGGGDVKLAAAAALLVPPPLVPSLLLATALAGGLLAALYLAASRLVPPPPPGRPAGLLARAWRCERWRLHRRGPLPYAAAIAAGALATLSIR